MPGYKRKPTRAPRAAEQSEAMKERDALASRNAELLTLNRQLAATVRIRDFEVERLLHDKVALCTELRNSRLIIDFLEGRERPGAVWVQKTKWTSR